MELRPIAYLFGVFCALVLIAFFVCFHQVEAADDLSFEIRAANRWPDHNRIELDPVRTYVNPLPCIRHPVTIVGTQSLVTVPIKVCETRVKLIGIKMQTIGNECSIEARRGADVEAQRIVISDSYCGIYADQSEVRFSNGYIWNTRAQSAYQEESVILFVNAELTRGVHAIESSHTAFVDTISNDFSKYESGSTFSISPPQ